MNKRIFISSTCFDLIDLRAELKKYLEKIGFIPVMSDQLDCEFDTYPDKNSIETCLVNLRSCDTVIFVLSQRYGGNLSKAGFGDYSATHLEYLEAVKKDKRILFFVRDRLEADYIQFKKTEDVTGLSWVSEKDIKIFDLITERRKLVNSENDNWFWTFRDVIEIKSRLEYELKTEMKAIRLDTLIETGNVPLITVTANAFSISDTSNNIELDCTIINAGNLTAIEPIFLLFKAENYKQVLEEEHHDIIGSYHLKQIRSLIASDSENIGRLSVEVSEKEKRITVAKYVIEVMYKTINGDLMADAIELKVKLLASPNLDVITRFTSKRFISDEVFEKLTS